MRVRPHRTKNPQPCGLCRKVLHRHVPAKWIVDLPGRKSAFLCDDHRPREGLLPE